MHDLEVAFGGIRVHGTGVDGDLTSALAVDLLDGRVDTSGTSLMLSKQTAAPSLSPQRPTA